MSWVKFSKNFDYDVPGKFGVTQAYPAGLTDNVPQDVADKAIAAGAAEAVKAPATKAEADAVKAGNAG